MYHTEPPTDKTIREWYMNSSRVAACALRNEQAVRAHRPSSWKIKLHITKMHGQQYIKKRKEALDLTRFGRGCEPVVSRVSDDSFVTPCTA